MEGIGFGFIPRAREWRVGVLNYLFFLPVGLALAVSLGFIRPALPVPDWRTAAVAVVTFLVTMWVLAAAEEFFFRGLLQQMLTRGLGRPLLGILLASLIFGAAHLAYRDFPNWRFALIACCAGLFYGRAYEQAKNIRAPMVTHALVVTTWRVFLS
jgi:membrane protease YdiL (CAAX protease family)